MNEEPPLENGNYDVALSCFSVAFALHASGQVVKGEAIRNHLGQGSLTTTIRYARLWNALQQGEDLNLSPVLRSAYEAAEGGQTGKPVEALKEDPPEDLAELGLDLGKLITDKAWAFLQQVIQQETLSALEEAEAREQAAFERAQGAEQERDAAITAHQDLEAECDRLQEVNAMLNGTNQQLVGELKVTKAGLEKSNRQHHEIQKRLYSSNLKLAQLRGENSKLKETIALDNKKIEKAETLQQENHKLKGRVTGIESQLIRERERLEKLETKNESLTQKLTTLTVQNHLLSSTNQK